VRGGASDALYRSGRSVTVACLGAMSQNVCHAAGTGSIGLSCL
jgi:hypothetical protein